MPALAGTGGSTIDIARMAHRIVELAEDKQAQDIILLDIRKQSTLADYFVICSVENERQMKAIIDHLDEQIHSEFERHPRIEGQTSTGWVVLDYADIIVHLFGKVQREYYQLERLWSQATPVLMVQ